MARNCHKTGFDIEISPSTVRGSFMMLNQTSLKRTLGVAGVLAALSGVLSTPAMAQAAAPAPAEKPAPKWEGSVGLGATVTQGNSDTVLFTARAQGLRKWRQNEVTVGADGTYGESNNLKNNDSLRVYGQYNRLVSERAFGYVLADLLHDDIADVSYRLNVGPGIGYYFIKEDRMILSAEGGPSFVFEDVGGRSKSYISARVAEKFEYKISDRARLWQKAEFLPQIDDLNNYIFNFEIGIETDITKSVKLEFYIVDSYDNEPAAGRKKNDIKLVAGVKYKF